MDITAFIRNALIEDVGNGDHTSLACIAPQAIGKARLLVKQPGVIAGIELATLICKEVDWDLEVEE